MEQIDSIYIPAETFWKNFLQPGWWVTASIIITLIIGFFLYKKILAKYILRKRFIKYFLDEPIVEPSKVNALLKAYILSLNSKMQIASLHGDKWRNFLITYCDMSGYMNQLDILSNYYKSNDNKVEELNLAAMHWIKNHKKIYLKI